MRTFENHVGIRNTQVFLSNELLYWLVQLCLLVSFQDELSDGISIGVNALARTRYMRHLHMRCYAVYSARVVGKALHCRLSADAAVFIG